MVPSLLLVDDNPAMIQLMAGMLGGVGRLRFARSGAAALEQMHAAIPDLVLLDAEMPGMTGFELCALMKQDARLADVPVIFVTAHDAIEFELRGLEAGAVDFISKPLSPPLLLARVRTQLRIKTLTDELRRLATVDGLTDTANRRGFDVALEREWLRARRLASPICALLIDVDHFKLYNDHYGHPAGDACLRKIAQALRAAVARPADMVARYGGEEFVILLPDTPAEGAGKIAWRVLAAVEALHMPHAFSPTAPHVSVSVGLGASAYGGRTGVDAAHPGGIPDALCLLRCADDALYAAKHAGRGQVWRLDLAHLARPEAAQRVDAAPASQAAS